MKKAKSDYLIQSVSRALDILEAFEAGQEELGVTELSRKLRLHKNNVFRLLATLETRGYVEQDRDSGNYRLGIKTFEVASVFLHHLGLVTQARAALQQLRAETGETAYLAVLDDFAVVCVDMAETRHAVRVVPCLGRRLPAHATALGKIQLAFRPLEEVEELWKRLERLGDSPPPPAEFERLTGELTRGVERDVAFEDEEFEPGVRGVAAPVRDYQRRVVGAIGVSGPASRLPMDRLERELAPRVRAAAQEVSRRLGYSFTPS